VLEIEFLGEEGTAGLGPTLEFYSLVAGELGKWLCDDHHQQDMKESSYNHGTTNLV
jgi:hypothetical protein